jgi:predicted PilT family ATPase
MNKVTIHNIKNQLHISLGITYEESMKKIKQLQSDKEVTHKGKYFLINVCVDDNKNNLKELVINPYLVNHVNIKKHEWDIKVDGFTIDTNDWCWLILEQLNENYIHISDMRTKAWGNHNEFFKLFWIELDTSEPFNLLEHL